MLKASAKLHVHVYECIKSTCNNYTCTYINLSTGILYMYMYMYIIIYCACTCTCVDIIQNAIDIHVYIHNYTYMYMYIITVKTVRSINTCGHLLYNPTGG